MVVVDGLEAVDVDVEQRETFLVALGAFERGVEAVEEQDAIGQAGERVVLRLVAHQRLDAPALGDLFLQLLVALLESGKQALKLLAGGPELDEDLELGAQCGLVDRLEHVIDGAEGVAAQQAQLAGLAGGEEDHRHVAAPLAGGECCGKLEAVHARHAHVGEDQREIVRGGERERLLTAVRLDELDLVVRGDVPQHRAVRGVVVDDHAS